jgi:hypothetical protein
MIRFLAVVNPSGSSGRVINVVDSQLGRVATYMRGKGYVIVGDFGEKQHATRALELYLRGWRPCPSAVNDVPFRSHGRQA